MSQPSRDGIPGYVAERIRQPPPASVRVVPGSTPVVAFGDPRRSQAATLGLNPSKREFFEKGRELDGRLRRFETLGSLELDRLDDAPDEAVERVWQRCNTYFRGNPYNWFGRLEEVLNAVGASYFGDTACHLDLSQWATDPTWNGLRPEERSRLITDDVNFLRTQLRSEPIRLLLLNGRGVLSAFTSIVGGEVHREGAPVSDATVTCRVYIGSFESVHVIGWSTNLQSSFGVTTALRRKLAERVAELAAPLT